MIALSIKNLHKTYKTGVVALRGISLEIAAGDFFALLGANGAGKSTAIGIVTSLVNKTSGSVEIFGKDVFTQPAAAKAGIGLVPQEFNFSIFETVLQIVCNQAGYYGIGRKLALERAEKYLKQLGIWEKRNAISRSLSGGMKRRLMIARAMIHEPQLLILDEPTAGVDIEIRRAMWDFLQTINAQGTTIILTTHYLEEAEQLCKNIAIIDHGLIVENTTMRDILSKLHQEIFILDLKQPLASAPQRSGFSSRWIDQSCIEVIVDKGQTLNQLFAELGKHNLQVVSLKNRHNRLEELFIAMLAEGNK